MPIQRASFESFGSAHLVTAIPSTQSHSSTEGMVTSNIVNLFYICGIISLLLNGCVVGVLVEDLPTSICCSNHTILRALPKIELHAHIHGSIRRRTLEELLSNRPDLAFDLTQKIDLVSGFKLFNVIHRVINSLELVERVTREVIDDFRADGVVYLELRTTPREIGEIGVKGKASKLEYLDSVCRVLHESNDKYRGVMISRLLVSIDRGSTIADAQTTIEAVEQILARKILARNTDTCIVGFDFSGNPHVNSFEMFRPIMEHARRVGRRVTVHAAEVKESLHLHDDETDMAAVLAFIPDRLGHALHLRETHLLQVFAPAMYISV